MSSLSTFEGARSFFFPATTRTTQRERIVTLEEQIATLEAELYTLREKLADETAVDLAACEADGQ